MFLSSFAWQQRSSAAMASSARAVEASSFTASAIGVPCSKLVKVSASARASERLSWVSKLRMNLNPPSEFKTIKFIPRMALKDTCAPSK